LAKLAAWVNAQADEGGKTAVLIFDCDGVLVDSEVIACSLLADMITGLGRPISVAETMTRFLGRSLKDAHIEIEGLIGRKLSAEEGEADRRRLLQRFREELQPVKGVREAILAVPGKRCVASSSSPDRLRFSLELTGLLELFDPHVFSAAQVKNGKPAPDLFLLAAKACGAQPQACIVVEDSPAGVTAARAAGMRAVGFIGASHATPELGERLRAAGAAPVIDDMRALPGAVAGLLA
jgi:HAD superfamily hydrolase (TIGR01509 family)